MAWKQRFMRNAVHGENGRQDGGANRRLCLGTGLATGLLLAALATPLAHAAEPIAETEADQPGIKLQVQELKRTSGGTVMLRFTVINESGKKLGLGSNYLGETNMSQDYRTVGGVHLIDAAGKKKYLVVRDSDGHCVCSKEMPDLAQDSSMTLWARFPAPPESVEKISVIVPHFIPMDDVPISR